MKKTLLILSSFLSLLLVSCGEEVLTQNTLSESYTAPGIKSYTLDKARSGSNTIDPEVDILYVVDNSGSTNDTTFKSLKSQIKSTIGAISEEFDYHVYIAPLNPATGDSITGYPLLVSKPDSISSIGSVNLVSPENLNFFAPAAGSNIEMGMQRALSLISANRTNGIFRSNANTIIVMVSNGDDTKGLITIGGNKVSDPSVYTDYATEFKKLTKTYADSNAVSNPLNSKHLRFISLVPHSNCNGWRQYGNYKRLSQTLYEYQSLTDNNATRDSFNICGNNFNQIFTAVNNGIRSVTQHYKYDHWKISDLAEDEIQINELEIIKVKADDSTEILTQDITNGYQYLGEQTNINTRYEPESADPVTGLVIKLNGTAKLTHPEYITAKTKSPVEYFGYISLPRNPDLATITLTVNGVDYPQSNVNGWTYISWRDIQNIKVPGPTNAKVTPAINISGYILQLHGNAIFTNGQTVKILYKPKSI